MTDTPIIAGVELGGTKCICILGRTPEEVIDQVRIETRDPEQTVAQIVATVDRWKSEHGFEALGIASFGPLDVDRDSQTYGSIVSTTKPGWSGTPLLTRFEHLNVPIGFDTDVIGAARAEQRWGAGRGLADLAYITVGTGIGVGAIAGDRPVAGFAHGEMGHMRVPRLPGDDWPGMCSFHGDCVEGLACGPAIAARHGPGPVADDWNGWASVENALAMLIHNVFVATQPRRVVMGGGVATERPALIQAVRERCFQSLADFYTAADLGDDFIVQAGLGAQAGPLGALALGIGALER